MDTTTGKNREQDVEVLPPERQDASQREQNPFLILGFWEFAIIATLVVVFFPWSLLFSLIFFGMETTKFLVFVLLHDFLKTLGAVISLLFFVVAVIIVLILMSIQ